MSTALAERPTTTAPEVDDLDRDGIEVFCPDSQGWSRTRDFFCESCGATDHDLR